MKKKLLLFTAAGFSIEFLNSSIKSEKESKTQLTTHFLTRLITESDFFETYVFEKILKKYDKNLVSKEELLRDYLLVIDKYRSLMRIVGPQHKDYDINFEHLIYLSELISDTDKNVLKGGKLIESMLKPMVLQNRIKKLSFSLDETLKVKSLILNTIYACFQINENKHKLKEFYANRKKNYDINFHILNYDLTLEESILDDNNYIDNSELKNFNHLHGQINLVHGNVIKKKDEAFIARTGQEVAQITKHKVSKIGTGNTFNSNEYRHDYDMISGLDKTTKMLNDHYSRAFHRFIIDAYSSTELIIIGYSFSDYHINSVFRNCIESYKRVTIVDYVDYNNTYSSEEGSVEEKKINHFKNEIWNFFIDPNPNKQYIDRGENNWDLKKIKTGLYKGKCKSIDIEFHFNGTLDFIENYNSLAQVSKI